MRGESRGPRDDVVSDFPDTLKPHLGETLMDRIKILLVEDSQPLKSAVSGFLSKNKHLEVAGVASSGKEALELASQLQPDLVLMDLELPGMSGLEATYFLKSKKEAPAVIILSSHSESKYKDAAFLAGADGFLNKSEMEEKLVRLITEKIRDRSTNRENASDSF